MTTRTLPADPERGALCALCGLPANALIHHAAANGHEYDEAVSG